MYFFLFILLIIVGKFSNKNAQSSCQFCPENEYQERSANTSCLKCIAPSSTNGEIGKTACSACAAGRAGISCTECAPGLYRGNDDVECLECTPGYFATKSGAPFCLTCAAGTYAAKDASIKCLACSNNTFVDEPRATNCRNCPLGLVPNNKSTACEKPPWKIPSDCSENEQYLKDTNVDFNEWTCLPCIYGADCSG